MWISLGSLLAHGSLPGTYFTLAFSITKSCHLQAMFLRHRDSGEPEIVKAPSPTSGLYIRTRGGKLIKVSIPSDCLAFQTGEALEIATDGRLLATPHCVRIGYLSETDKVSRESFALFMQPNTNVLLSPTTTFGEFSKKIFGEHYNTQEAL